MWPPEKLAPAVKPPRKKYERKAHRYDYEWHPNPQFLVKYRKYNERWPTKAPRKPTKKSFWITTKEAADLLCVSPERFRQVYLRTGKLPYIVKGPNTWLRKAYIPRAAVQELLVSMITTTARRNSNSIKRRLSVIKGLDQLERHLHGNPITTRRKPKFLSGSLNQTQPDALSHDSVVNKA